jgi:hypothetical protein
MTRPATIRRGIFLAELLAVIAIGILLLALLGKLVTDAIYLQTIAAQHSNRTAVMDALSHRLRQDTLAAVAYEESGKALTLHVLDTAGSSQVTYTFTPELVRRTTSAGDEGAWQSQRLEFAWQVESGARADVLVLDFIEIPPPRRAGLPPRTFSTPFLLPPGPTTPRPLAEDLP